MMRNAFRTVGVPLAVLCVALAQNAPSPAFDAASVKPSTDPNDHGAFRISPGRFTASQVTLKGYIHSAFGVEDDQIAGGPNWIETDRWTIFAEAEGDHTRAQMMAMLQTLLADRFKLKVHRETREINVYALVSARGGHKLKEVAGTDPETYVRVYPKGPLTLLDGHKASMEYFAGRLRSFVNRPVQDQTGLKGEFDFKVEFASGQNPDPSIGPDLFTAIQEQLGLKLDARKGAIEMLIIDHAEKPAAN